MLSSGMNILFLGYNFEPLAEYLSIRLLSQPFTIILHLSIDIVSRQPTIVGQWSILFIVFSNEFICAKTKRGNFFLILSDVTVGCFRI